MQVFLLCAFYIRRNWASEQRADFPQMTRWTQSFDSNIGHAFSTFEVVIVSPWLVRFGEIGGFVLFCFVGLCLLKAALSRPRESKRDNSSQQGEPSAAFLSGGLCVPTHGLAELQAELSMEWGPYPCWSLVMRNCKCCFLTWIIHILHGRSESWETPSSLEDGSGFEPGT